MSVGRARRLAGPLPPPLLLLLLLALSCSLLGAARAERASGLYVDNGFDQTVVHRVASQREKREVEHEILNLLGLPDRPPKHRAGRDGSPQVKRSAPKFLLDIYRSALDEEARRPGAELGLTGPELRAIEQSDVIMTFAAHNHHVPGVRHERGKRLWFDVSEVPASEAMLGAELRLYRSLAGVRPARNRAAFTLTAYRVLRLEDGERELQFIGAANASAGREGWLSLNVSEALEHWVREPAGNRGLYLSVHPADRHVHEVKPEDIGIVGFRGVAERQPFMVGFFKSAGVRQQRLAGSAARRAARSKREAKKDKPKKSQSSLPRPSPYSEPAQLPAQAAAGPPGANNTRTCKIQTLYVSFRDLQWQDWIIAPDGYDAYYCSGECNFPLNAHMNATNHAIVQTLVHLVNPGKVPKPCCAPTKLSPISVLYFLDESNVILKKYKNMVVKSCGCH